MTFMWKTPGCRETAFFRIKFPQIDVAWERQPYSLIQTELSRKSERVGIDQENVTSIFLTVSVDLHLPHGR